MLYSYRTGVNTLVKSPHILLCAFFLRMVEPLLGLVPLHGIAVVPSQVLKDQGTLTLEMIPVVGQYDDPKAPPRSVTIPSVFSPDSATVDFMA